MDKLLGASSEFPPIVVPIVLKIVMVFPAITGIRFHPMQRSQNVTRTLGRSSIELQRFVSALKAALYFLVKI